MNNILITGSSGFIGSNLCNYINEYDIIKVDKKIGFDIFNKEKLEDIFKSNKIDVIIQLAAIPGVRYSIEHSEEVLHNNIEGFDILCRLAIKYNIKHFIYASSSSIYGDNGTPKSPYAVSKKTNELQAQMYSQLYTNIKFTGLRFFTVYGKGIREDLFISKCIKALNNNSQLIVYGDGNQTRDFTYVDDICEAIKRIIESDKYWNYEIFDIGYGEAISINNLISILKKIINPEFNNIIYEDSQLGDVINTLSDTSKLYEFFNFVPIYDIRCGLKKYLNV